MLAPIFEQIRRGKVRHNFSLKLLVRDCKSGFIIPCDEDLKRDPGYNARVKSRGDKYIEEFRAATHNLNDRIKLEVKTYRLEPFHKGIIVNRETAYWSLYPITTAPRGTGGKKIWDYYGPGAKYVELHKGGSGVEATTFDSIVEWFDTIWGNFSLPAP
jgi:hypothetical protein